MFSKYYWIQILRILFNNLFQSAELSVFETNIRFVGGLLTLYAFTGDTMYKEKAQEVADKLLPAFQTPTGIPNALVNIRTGVSTFFAIFCLVGIYQLKFFNYLHFFNKKKQYSNLAIDCHAIFFQMG